MACWFQCWENATHFVYGAIDVKIDGCVFEEKSSFKMLGLTFSFKLDWGSYIISVAITVSKKIWVLITSMKFLSPEVPQPCVEYCCHVWARAPSFYLELLENLQKRMSLLNRWLIVEM